MSITQKIETNNNDILDGLRKFFKALLNMKNIHSILVPQHLPAKNAIMPTLVADPTHLKRVDPLAPAFPINTAKIVSRLTRKPAGAKIAAVLRPCEIRALIELVKLNQGCLDDVILIGIDCLGTFQNKDYAKLAGNNPEALTRDFCNSLLHDQNNSLEAANLAPACQACEYPIPDNTDISIGLYGMNSEDFLLVQSNTDTGDMLLTQCNLPEASIPETRRQAIDATIAKRIRYRDEMIAKTIERTDSLEKLSNYFSTCVNCYNCRVACPVCYCKECVFVTDVFNHEPIQYLRWAERRGMIKMPTDTLFYHITRLVHMSTACVGCGQCSNACPNDLPVMELFRTIALTTQQAFGYEAGKQIDEAPPLSVFRENEFSEVVGIMN